MLGLSQIQLIIIGGLAAVVLMAGGIAYIYHRGETAGSSAVTTAVQHETVKTLDRARQDRETMDRKVRDAPLDSVIDSLK